MSKGWGVALAIAAGAGLCAVSAQADENLFGYVKGVETLPEGAWEAYQWATVRADKGRGDYTAVDTETEVEYGFTDRFTGTAGLNTMSIDTGGLIIDGYLPGDREFTLRPSGIELAGKFNFLKPAIDPLGFAMMFEFDYGWIDPHSGQDKLTLSTEIDFLVQKYMMEGQLVWVGNFGIETTYADRDDISDLPPGFDWPTDPEMEIELKVGSGLTYRFAPNWYAGAEASYETEFETEVGQERWSLFAGPTLHYAAEEWWLTATWFPQVVGGGEKYENQDERDLHLIEKTKQEFRLKVGLNF
jgi:hypothetical protein